MSKKLLIENHTQSLITVDVAENHLLAVFPPECNSCHKFGHGRCLVTRKPAKPEESGCPDHRWWASFERLLDAAENLQVHKNQASLEELERFSEADSRYQNLIANYENGIKPQPELKADRTIPSRVKVVSEAGPGGIVALPIWLNGSGDEVVPVMRSPEITYFED